jgi:hypothetical protein
MINVSDKSYNFCTKIMGLRDNVDNCRAGQATVDNITRRMRINKATETVAECVMLIAFRRQLWLRECASMLRLYAHCLPYLCVQKDPL